MKKILNEKKLRQVKGITLIALIITIIVLIILAGVTIAGMTGENGIITRAKEAKEKTEIGSLLEQIRTEVLEKSSESIDGDITKKEFREILEEYFDNVPESLPDDILDKTLKLKSKYGSHDILMRDIYDGTFSDVEVGDNEDNDHSDDPPTKTPIVVDGSWNEKKGVNNPKITDLREMMPVYWNENNEEIEYYNENGTLNEEFNAADWYDYAAADSSKAGTEEGDSRMSKWANAKTSDGSYWVWIPRYAYKITKTTTVSKEAGTIDVKFLQGTSNKGNDGITTYDFPEDDTTKPLITTEKYVIHPAFCGSGFEDLGGGFGKDANGIEGFWVAKFEMSYSNSSLETMGNGNTFKSVPNVQSTRKITIGEMFNYAQAYDGIGSGKVKHKDSHLVKNSEWGAIAYLTHSQYGRNGNEVTKNNSSTYITGNAGNQVIDTKNEGITNAYNTEKGCKASSTGNITGVYDISGGADEYVAIFDSKGNTTVLNKNGGSFINAEKSTKYVTIYNGGEDTTITRIYEVGKIGDASKEIYIDNLPDAWFWDRPSFVSYNGPFLMRGSVCYDGNLCGIFYSSTYPGIGDDITGFRIALIQ